MNKTTYINGLNKSVYETVDMKFDFYGCRETSKEYSYTDTGYSKEHKFGYGYNGEALDDTGLIYLRARYYNSRIGQFIQLDTYKGEQNSIESQNRYAYTMNNPYKYVDRGGNTTFHEMTYGTKPKPANTKTPKKNTTVYPPHSYQGWSDLNSKKTSKPKKQSAVNKPKPKPKPKPVSDPYPDIVDTSIEIISFINQEWIEQMILKLQECMDKVKNDEFTDKERIYIKIGSECDKLYEKYKTKFKDGAQLREIKKIIEI